jgi:hypothetical protein
MGPGTRNGRSEENYAANGSFFFTSTWMAFGFASSFLGISSLEKTVGVRRGDLVELHVRRECERAGASRTIARCGHKPLFVAAFSSFRSPLSITTPRTRSRDHHHAMAIMITMIDSRSARCFSSFLPKHRRRAGDAATVEPASVVQAAGHQRKTLRLRGSGCSECDSNHLLLCGGSSPYFSADGVISAT